MIGMHALAIVHHASCKIAISSTTRAHTEKIDKHTTQTQKQTQKQQQNKFISPDYFICHDHLLIQIFNILWF